MQTFLLTWNPRRWAWEDLPEAALEADPNKPLHRGWSCGTNKNILPGARVFLLRQGMEPRGIIGSGTVTSKCFTAEHWDADEAAQGKQANYISVQFDMLLDPSITEPLTPLKHPELADGINWRAQSSGTVIKPEIAHLLESLWWNHVTTVRPDAAGPDQLLDEDEMSFPEGRTYYRMHRQRERNYVLVRLVKDRAAQSGALFCQACGFDFAVAYGVLGKGYIEAHHTVPISELDSDSLTREQDIALVCSNCHRMLHRKRPWLRMEELKAILTQ